MSTAALFVAAAIAEIAGAFSFWAWARLEARAIWLLPGIASLILFAYLLARVDVAFAGRAYAAYGGVYIAASLVWLWLVEGQGPDRFDLLGAGLCLVGATIIIWGPHAT